MTAQDGLVCPEVVLTFILEAMLRHACASPKLASAGAPTALSRPPAGASASSISLALLPGGFPDFILFTASCYVMVTVSSLIFMTIQMAS